MDRPKTSQLVIDIISLLVDHQDMKGFEKYGFPLMKPNTMSMIGMLWH
jgi:hypothetical protein